MLVCFHTKEVKNIILLGNQSCVSHERQKVCHRAIDNAATFYSPLIWRRLFFFSRKLIAEPSALRHLHKFTNPTVQLKGLFMIVGPLETSDPCAALIVTHSGPQHYYSLLVEVCLARWNEMYMGYSTELRIILWVWWTRYSQTNHILWLLICYRIMHNERRREKDGFGSDLSPSTSTRLVSVFQCRRAAAGLCMLPMSRLQETVLLCFSLFLTSSLTFFSSPHSHYNFSNTVPLI